MPESSQIRANFTSPDGAINGRATILVANLEDAEPFVGEYSTLLLKLAESFVGNCKSAQFATSDISKNVLNIFAQEGSYLFELTCASIVID